MRRILLTLLIPTLLYAQVPPLPPTRPQLWSIVGATLRCELTPFTSIKEVMDLAKEQYTPACSMDMLGKVFRVTCGTNKFLYFTFFKEDCDALSAAMRKVSPKAKKGLEI